MRGTALHSQAMLEYKGLLRQSEHCFWEICSARLTCYVGCKDCLSNQNIFTEKPVVLDLQAMLEHANFNQGISSEKSVMLDSQAMLKHAKIHWVFRTSPLRIQWH